MVTCRQACSSHCNLDSRIGRRQCCLVTSAPCQCMNTGFLMWKKMQQNYLTTQCNNFRMMKQTHVPRRPYHAIHFWTGERVDHPAPAGHWEDIADERVQYHQHHHHCYHHICMIPVLVVHKLYFDSSQNQFNVDFRHLNNDQRGSNDSKVEGHLSTPANIW